MSDFEKKTEHMHGRTVTITSWMDVQTDTWKASAPGFILHHGRADENGQPSRQAAIALVVREMESVFNKVTGPRKPM